MGICLDTDKNPNYNSHNNGPRGRQNWDAEDTDDRNDSDLLPDNNSHVKFNTPKVPIIFVLGGPGSGKVTHCDNLMTEKRGIVHVNMTDLLQQYTVGNDMEDYNKLSSKTVTEVLMLELKMSPAAKLFLISGFPRNMRDVVEYTQKIKLLSKVILIAWSQSVLERQIDYGAKLGQVVLSLAKMELSSFYNNVSPVTEYYDQRGLLISINGERNPSEVYLDFRSTVLQVLSAHLATGAPPPALPNGHVSHYEDTAGHNSVTTVNVEPATVSHNPDWSEYPRVIWVIGGPGSNKSSLCQKVLRTHHGWGHVSMGSVLRSLASAKEPTDPLQHTIGSGQIVDKAVVYEVLNNEMLKHRDSKGIVIDGFPRTVEQLNYFEKKYAQRPLLILLDCSKLQLGRGRLDDSVSAFRHRLENFREQTLPMLKMLDDNERLIVVDGNTEDRKVQDMFVSALVNTIKSETATMAHQVVDDDGTVLHDLESHEEPEARSSHAVTGPAVPHQNGFIPNAQTSQALKSNDLEQRSRQSIRTMYAQIGSYPKNNVLQ